MDDREQALIRSAQVALERMSIACLARAREARKDIETEKLEEDGSKYSEGYADAMEWAAGEAEARSRALGTP